MLDDGINIFKYSWYIHGIFMLTVKNYTNDTHQSWHPVPPGALGIGDLDLRAAGDGKTSILTWSRWP